MAAANYSAGHISQTPAASVETSTMAATAPTGGPNYTNFVCNTDNITYSVPEKKMVDLYTVLCPIVLFICTFSVLFNALLICISRQGIGGGKKTSVVLLSLNLAITDLIAAFLNGMAILTNSYLPIVHGCWLPLCWLLVFEIIRCAALVSSALHLLALAIVHYQGTFRPLLYRSEVFCSQHLSRTINIISLVCWIIPITILTIEFSTTKGQGFWTGPGEPCEPRFMLKSNYRYKLIAMFLLPLLIMFAIYARIIPEIRRIQKVGQNNLNKWACNSVASNLASGPAMNLPQLMAPTAVRTAAAAVESQPLSWQQQQQQQTAASAEKGNPDVDGVIDEGDAKQWSGNRSVAGGCAHNASTNIKFNLTKKESAAESGLVKCKGDKIHRNYSGRAVDDNHIVCDHREQPSATFSSCSRSDKRGENSLVGGESAVHRAASTRSVVKPGGDEANSMAPLAGLSGDYSVALNDGLDKGLTTASCSSSSERSRQSARDVGESKSAAESSDDCCPEGNSAGGSPSRLAEARRRHSCRSRTPKVALRTQFSLGTRFLVPPSSSKPPARQQLARLKQPSKSSLKKQHLTFDQNREVTTTTTTTEPTAAESTWECRACDNNKLERLSVGLARSTGGDVAPMADGDGRVSPNIDRAEDRSQAATLHQGTPVTMSISGRRDSQGASSISAATVRTVGPSGGRKRPPKLGRSMTTASASDSLAQQQQIRRKRRNYFTGSIVGRRTAATARMQSDGGTDKSNLSRQQSTTITNAGSIAGSSIYENNHNNNSNNNNNGGSINSRISRPTVTVPRTNSKAVKTTLIILGTYCCSYGPALIFQYLTCEDGCPVKVAEMEFEWKVFWGTSTTILVIVKSIIDPLIYFYRLSEIKDAIKLYISRRRSRSSKATSIMRSSQRFQSSIYTNNTCNNDNSVTNFTPTLGQQLRNKLQKDLRPAAASEAASMKISLKQQESGSTKSAASARIANRPFDDSPSRRLAKRFQSFDRYDDHSTAQPAVASNPSAVAAESSLSSSGSSASPSSSSSSSSSYSRSIIHVKTAAAADRRRSNGATAAAGSEDERATLLAAREGVQQQQQASNSINNMGCNGSQLASSTSTSTATTRQ